MKKIFLLLSLCLGSQVFYAQQDTRLLRFPAIHGNQLVFTYAGDLYTVAGTGGEARKLTNAPGFVMFARFSPDGSQIAFTGNYGGHIERDCAAGRGRMDLGIEYNGNMYIIEIKLLRSYHSPTAFRKKGLEQIVKYRDKFNAKAPAYLIIFDRRPETKSKSWEERISWEHDGDVNVLGC
jgi:hypothetical protein